MKVRCCQPSIDVLLIPEQFREQSEITDIAEMNRVSPRDSPPSLREAHLQSVQRTELLASICRRSADYVLFPELRTDFFK
eukprot:6182561-Pleurochrysis_carterae.AAC.2